MKLFRFWFTFETPVSRRMYLVHGASLMLVKYGVDAALVTVATGEFWSPFDYLQTPFMLSARFHGAPVYLAPALAVWTLPFLWIGVTMTIRRLLDTGLSAWTSLLFFVPYVNYGLMLSLVALPTGRARPVDRPRLNEALIPSALLSMAAGVAIGLAMLAWSVYGLNSYGLSLFMGTPFAVGLVTGFLLCRRYPASVAETYEVVAMTMLLIGGMAFVLGTEGVVCLLMVLPLGLLVALLGGTAGRAIASSQPRSAPHAALVLLLLPAGMGVEADADRGSVREVKTSIVIAAPPDDVWAAVIAFPPLAEPAGGLFALGVAYPRSARISGEGVGAIRRCVFSTGAFIEPITHWEPGRRLAFDVVDSPLPLRELTFRDGVTPPHLVDYLMPRRGEFRLASVPGGTVLEGSTWYEQRLQPEGYWVVFSDYIIHAIHRRVLNHVKAVAERGGR